MKHRESILQFVKFALVGASNTLISEGIYALLVFLKIHYIPASFTGFSLSVVNAYYWNNKYVFREREGGEKRVWWKVFCKTYLAYFWGYLANAALLVFWIDLLRIERFLSPVADWFAARGLERLDARFCGNLAAAGLNLLFTTPMNYIVNKYWAYRQKTKPAAKENAPAESSPQFPHTP